MRHDPTVRLATLGALGVAVLFASAVDAELLGGVPQATAVRAPLSDEQRELVRQVADAMKAGKATEALRLIEKFRAAAPPLPRLLFVESHLAKAVGQHVRAQRALSEYIRLAPADDEHYVEARSTYSAAKKAADADLSRTGRRRASPKGNVGDWITERDYPYVALRNEASGATRVMLAIDETGRVADCTVTQRSGSAELDAHTCSVLLRRARFSPSTNKKGQLLPSVHEQTVRWTIPQ